MNNDGKIIYTKYSNDRIKKYQICTQIIEYSEQKKIVRKSAVSQEAVNHIQNMITHKNSLDECFAGTKFKTNNIFNNGFDFVDFDFIQGERLDILLDEYLKNLQFDKFFDVVTMVFEQFEKCKKISFSSNEICDKIFGKSVFDENESAISIADIDLVFQNILLDSNCDLHVIDYEWIYDFSLPLDFLKWRCLYTYIAESPKRQILYEKDIYSYFGFSESKIQKYIQLELHFQKMITDEHCFAHVASRILKPKREIRDIIDDNCIEVFFDTGNGFSEEEKQVFYNFPIEISLPNNLKALRVDPTYFACSLFVKYIRDEFGKDLTYSTNGLLIQKDSILFNTNDPQIFINILKETSKILLDISYKPIDDFIFDEVNNLNKQIEKRNQQIEDQIRQIEKQNQQIEKQNQQIEDQNQHIENQNQLIKNQNLCLENQNQQILGLSTEVSNLHNSMSWKITKPFRFLLGLFSKK